MSDFAQSDPGEIMLLSSARPDNNPRRAKITDAVGARVNDFISSINSFERRETLLGMPEMNHDPKPEKANRRIALVEQWNGTADQR